MNDFKEAKIRMFVNDLTMSQAIYEVIRNSFLSKKGVKDVQILAAERLAVDLLDDAWKELEKHKQIKNDEPPERAQVGL